MVGFSHLVIGPFASDSILMKPLNFILLNLLNKNIFYNCAEEMKNCRDWERGGRTVFRITDLLLTVF